jgi:hypothetical protein
MEWRHHAAVGRQVKTMSRLGRGAVLALVVMTHGAGSHAATAATMSSKDVQVLGRVLAFLQPPPASGEIAVVYAAGDASSRWDAEAIVAQIGSGLKVGGAVLQPRLVERAALADGGFPVTIIAAGANGPQVGAAIRASHSLCVTGELEAVQAGLCTMSIRSEPRVDIVINHAAAAASGVEFAAAFRMMIREI